VVPWQARSCISDRCKSAYPGLTASWARTSISTLEAEPLEPTPHQGSRRPLTSMLQSLAGACALSARGRNVPLVGVRGCLPKLYCVAEIWRPIVAPTAADKHAVSAKHADAPSPCVIPHRDSATGSIAKYAPRAPAVATMRTRPHFQRKRGHTMPTPMLPGAANTPAQSTVVQASSLSGRKVAVRFATKTPIPTTTANANQGTLVTLFGR